MSASDRWQALRDLDLQLTYRTHELAVHRAAGDKEKLRATALEVLILRKQIREIVRR